jgi:hypothetical protein
MGGRTPIARVGQFTQAPFGSDLSLTIRAELDQTPARQSWSNQIDAHLAATLPLRHRIETDLDTVASEAWASHI